MCAGAKSIRAAVSNAPAPARSLWSVSAALPQSARRRYRLASWQQRFTYWAADLRIAALPLIGRDVETQQIGPQVITSLTNA
jgi:hypothetical protein